MGLQAFTQEVGVHTKREFREERQRGKYYDNDFVDESINFFDAYVEESRKPSPTPSNHHRPTDYSRSVIKVPIDIPAQWRRFVTVGSPAEVVIDLTGDYYISKDMVIGTAFDPDPGYDNMVDKSVTSALNSLNGSDAGAGADLGQTRKTIDEFAVLASKFAQTFLALRRGNFKQAYKALVGLTGKHQTASASHGIAGLWLAFIYGVKPLMQDLYELYKTYDEFMQKPQLIKGHGKGMSDYSYSGSSDRYNWKGKVSSTARTVLIAKVTNRYLHALNEAGLTNPIDIAWELLPWSFVFDWFIPVGQTLQAMTASVGLESEGGWTTVHQTNELDVFHNVDYTGYGYGFSEPGHYRQIGFSFTRIAYVGFPVPQFYANARPYSTVRALNAVALVRQLT